MHIGFLGLGNMGMPMAHSLIKAGHQLTIFDPCPQAAGDFSGANTQVADSIEALTRQPLHAIITMLPNTAYAKEVYLGDQGLLAHVRSGVLLIDGSTIDPFTAREIATAAAKQGNAMLDAPVSGTANDATAGTLTFMVGGDVLALRMAQSVFAAMGTNIVHCGESGNGQVAHITSKMLLAINMLGVAEAMGLGVSLGIDAEVMAGIVTPALLRSFDTDLMLKDLDLATEVAKQTCQPVILGALAQRVYQTFGAQDNGSLDFSVLANLYRKDV